MGGIGKGLWPTLGGILLLLLLLSKVANSCGLLDSNPQGDQELQEENDKPIPYQNTLYYEVADYDNPNIKKLLDAGANPDESFVPKGTSQPGLEEKAGFSALHMAVDTKQREEVELLLDYGANIDIKSKDGRGLTPLHLAVLLRDENMVKLLVNNGADINAQDNNGCTPLCAAAKSLLDDLDDFPDYFSIKASRTVETQREKARVSIPDFLKSKGATAD